MHVAFGAAVFGLSGERLGDVDGLVVDAGTKRARAILVDAGFLGQTKRMVAVSAVDRSDGEGLHLDATDATTRDESPAVGEEEVSFPERVQPPIDFISAAGAGGPVVAVDPAVQGPYPGNTSFFDVAPIDPPPVEVESNLGENEVILGKRTRAISSDGHDVGDVESFELGDLGLVDAIGLESGLIFKDRATLPLADIDEFGTDAVHLRLTRAQAEAR
jgi:hypothetical protein